MLSNNSINKRKHTIQSKPNKHTQTNKQKTNSTVEAQEAHCYCLGKPQQIFLQNY